MKEDFYSKYNEKKYSENYWQMDRSPNKWFGKYVRAKILEKWIKKIKNRNTLLDAGGGVGNWAAYFQNKFKKIIVLDVSKRALDNIPEKGIIKIRGSILNMPIKKDSVDCVLLIDVFEHIYKKDLSILLSELDRVTKKEGRILIFTNQYGFGLGLFWKRLLGNKNSLTKGDIQEGHLNRLKFNEMKKIFYENNLEIEDFYHYSIFFQQITDFFKDSFAKIFSSILGRGKIEGKRKGQLIKEETRKRENNIFVRSILCFFSIISYLDIIIFGKIIPGASIFIKLKKL